VRHTNIRPIVALSLVLASAPANALRCGNKLVVDGMHEAEVIRACGEPVSTEHLGYVIRHYGPFGDDRAAGGFRGWRREVPVTEMIFNFGPHRLMRKLRFEGGMLTSIRTLGYGYRE